MVGNPSRSTLRGLQAGDPQRAAVGAGSLWITSIGSAAPTPLDSVRRESNRERAARRPKGTRDNRPSRPIEPAIFCSRKERLTERERPRLCALFGRNPVLAEATSRPGGRAGRRSATGVRRGPRRHLTHAEIVNQLFSPLPDGLSVALRYSIGVTGLPNVRLMARSRCRCRGNTE
jgi:hypothetical protein